MQGLATDRLDRALNADAAAKGAPEWVHLLPGGFMQGRDGRSFDLADPGGLILAFQANGIDLPVDYDHQADKPSTGPTRAAGRIKELQARADGIWGRIEWTATAAELIAAKEYRFISPVILHHPKTREVVRLIGAGLVHRPNLHLPALNAQAVQMPPAEPCDTPDLAGLFDSLVRFFGLPADATVAQVMAALGTVKAQLTAPPDPAQYMPVQAVQAMMAERSAELATATEGRAQLKVDAAFRQGYIHGGMRDWALALCKSDEAAFDTFLLKSGPMFGGLTKTHTALNAAPPAARASYRSDAADSICAQLGLPSGSLMK